MCTLFKACYTYAKQYFFYYSCSTISRPENTSSANLSNTRPPSMWCGFDMSNFPPLNFAGATMSWLYMPIIFMALGITCDKWTFPRSQLPRDWYKWVAAYQQAFQPEREEILQYVHDHFDTPEHDHIDADAQDDLIHDRFHHVHSVSLAAEEMQEWAIELTF